MHVCIFRVTGPRLQYSIYVHFALDTVAHENSVEMEVERLDLWLEGDSEQENDDQSYEYISEDGEVHPEHSELVKSCKSRSPKKRKKAATGKPYK